MTLAFSQYIDKKPTYFVEKILKSIQHLPVGKEFRDYVLSDYYQEAFNDIENPKIHTIRADTKNRWKVGSKIHMVINNRTKNRLQFAPVLEVKQVQDFEIKYEVKENDTLVYVYIGNKYYGQVRLHHCKVSSYMLSVHKLAINDGFDSVNDFLEYFSEDFKGKIIHWTDFKY